MTGEKTSVHKPLLSAGEMTDKGHALWLDADTGFIIQKDSPIAMALSLVQAILHCTDQSW